MRFDEVFVGKLEAERDALRIVAEQLDRWRTAWASQDTSDANPARRAMFKALDYWKSEFASEPKKETK